MQIIGRSKFLDETSGKNAAKIFPYLTDRLDAISEIKEHYSEIDEMTSMTRRIAMQGRLGRRIASIPLHILDEGALYYGTKLWWLDSNRLHTFLRANPEWSFIYGRK